MAPVYETVRILSQTLPPEVALIGFAGAPWTVATYMIAGRGTPNQEPARRMLLEQPDAFFTLLDLITEATIEYLARQVEAGAEAVKLFDSWAGSLSALDFERVCLEPNRRITAELKSRFPGLPVIAFPRGAGAWLERFADSCGADCVALLMVAGGEPLAAAARRIREDLSGGPHVFNLGHGITPDADPENVHILLDAIRG